MDFALTPEQVLIAETARRIGEEYGLDYWAKLDKEKTFPAAMWRAIAQAGLAGVALPEEHGGGGQGMLELALVIENLCAGGAGATLAQVFMLNPIFGGVSLARYGTPAQKADLLPKLCRGEINFCMALTEPDAGTNTLEIKTFARADGNGWRLDGRKIWITGVPDAAKMLVVARTKRLEESQRKTDGLSLFMVDVARAGLTHTTIEKHGTNTLASCNVYFDDVRVDGSELVGTLHGGWAELLDVLNTERIVTVAGLVGAGRLAARLGVDYAKERKVFRGKPIGAYQGIQFPLAQAHAALECARLMNYKAAALHDRGEPYGSEANMAKLIAAQAAPALIDRAMQTMGGMGFAREMHVERLLRDSRLFRFAPISEEMLLNFIAQHDLGLPRSY
ncbi:MAG: acyl-CoA dehydrogenase [Alphaproteobacteria bacterium]|nr:acyl-CoA dehydrogenase [Alphaproteobacteria bacterium]